MLLPFREHTSSSFIPPGLHQGHLNCSNPSQSFSLGYCTPIILHFPSSSTFPKLQQQGSPTGAIWALGGGKFCTHRSIGAAGFRVRSSHIVHFMTHITAKRSQSHWHTPTAPCLHHVENSLLESGLASTEKAAERQHEILLLTYLSNHLKHQKQLSPGAPCAEAAPHSQLSCSCSSHLMEGGDYQEIWHKE